MKRETGKYQKTTVTGEEVLAFVPHSLPPKDPALNLSDKILELIKVGEESLAKLNLASEMVPSIDWFIYAYVRKEAVTSSQIEGTQATLVDLFSFEAEESLREIDNPDIEEVCNYLEAIQYARKELNKPKGLPISTRLLNQIHKRLMNGVRGSSKTPGSIRKSQNWIGGSRPSLAQFVQAPPNVLDKVLSDLEKFIHSNNNLNPLIKIGLLHVQFETIHPYLDGNGRIGRLLITLLMEHWGFLKEPLLYLSLYFKRNRKDYYYLLDKVRTDGDWESWIEFFIQGVIEISQEATNLAKDLFILINEDRKRLLKSKQVSLLVIQLFEILPAHPVITMPQVVEWLQTTKPTAIKVIEVLEKEKILTEMSGRKRDRHFGYHHYLEKLKSGTELEFT